MFDYAIVGSGLFGATFAYEASKAGKKCLVIERRPHIGGNCYTKNIYGIDVHMYGAHIFKTDSKETWDYINQFAVFNSFINTPVAISKGEAFNLPFNMNTFARVFGITKPREAMYLIAIEKKSSICNPRNLEEKALMTVGPTIYNRLIRGYTEKQWGKPCSQLPTSILNDIPIRFTYNNNYYDKRYQGVPIGGYTNIIRKMLENSRVITNTSFEQSLCSNAFKARKIIYTGAIDEYFGYALGKLEYRSLKFVHTYKEVSNENGVAVMNFVDSDVPYTRVIEHKHFCNQQSDKTVLTYEYPKEFTGKDDAYYPIEDKRNQGLYQKYAEMAKEKLGDSVIFCGRLGSYHYDDMSECIENARKLAMEELKRE